MSTDPEWKTIKIPADAYDMIARLRERLVNLGFGSLPDHLQEEFAEGGGVVGIGMIVRLGLVDLQESLDKVEERVSASRKKRKR